MNIDFGFDVNQLAQQIGDASKVVAEKLGLPLTNLWTMGVRYEYVKGIADIFTGTVFACIVFLAVILLGLCVYAAGKATTNSGGDAAISGIVISSIIIVLCGIISIIFFYNGILESQAPDAMFAKEIANQVQYFVHK